VETERTGTAALTFALYLFPFAFSFILIILSILFRFLLLIEPLPTWKAISKASARWAILRALPSVAREDTSRERERE
jgi:hypothetical protein